MKFVKGRDLIIIFLVLIAILILYYHPKSGGNKVIVEIAGKRFLEIDKVGTYPIIVDGKRITTVVYDGERVRVIGSNCPLKICEKMGWIKPGGEIICVPNKLVVRFEKEELDAMTW